MSGTSVSINKAEAYLKSIGLYNLIGGKLPKTITVRDFLVELLEAAQRSVVSDDLEGEILLDEDGWRKLLNKGMVKVNDPAVGMSVLKLSADDTDTYQSILDAIVKDGMLVIPLSLYPGIKLFPDKPEVSAEARAKSKKREVQTG